jgi:hypothetical protein
MLMIRHASCGSVTKPDCAYSPTGYVYNNQYMATGLPQTLSALTYPLLLAIKHIRERMFIFSKFVLALRSRLVGNSQAFHRSGKSSSGVECRMSQPLLLNALTSVKGLASCSSGSKCPLASRAAKTSSSESSKYLAISMPSLT